VKLEYRHGTHGSPGGGNQQDGNEHYPHVFHVGLRLVLPPRPGGSHIIRGGFNLQGV